MENEDIETQIATLAKELKLTFDQTLAFLSEEIKPQNIGGGPDYVCLKINDAIYVDVWNTGVAVVVISCSGCFRGIYEFEFSQPMGSDKREAKKMISLIKSATANIFKQP